MNYNSDFPVLSTIAKVMRFTGWALVIAAVCIFGYTFMESKQAGHYWGSGNTAYAVGGIVSLIVGLFVEAFAEIIGVLFAIELNTRKA